MSGLPIVAVIGRPNVGKSTLVNRILRRRAAVVNEESGVTRDRREFLAEWDGRDFLLTDTGGWEMTPDEALTAGIRTQAESAVKSADLIVFVADATSEITDDDQGVARLLLRSKVPYLFVANKADSERIENDLDHLWSLGLGAPIAVSAAHGRGTGDMLSALVEMLPEEGSYNPSETIASLAIIGRPNVGKSTLLNKLAGEDRVLVSDVAGTTRDPINLVVQLDGEPVEVIDTAGIKRRTKVTDETEQYAVMRARETLRHTDVALLVIDGTKGVTHQDQRLAEEIADAGVGIIVLLNKWDIIDDDARERTEDGVADRLAFISWAPVLRLSAMTGARLHRLPKTVRAVLETRRQRIPTPELNRLIRSWTAAHPPPMRKGKRPRIIYAVQAESEPPTIILFVRSGDIGPDYLRFLEGRIREHFDFTGTPIRLYIRKRHSRQV